MYPSNGLRKYLFHNFFFFDISGTENDVNETTFCGHIIPAVDKEREQNDVIFCRIKTTHLPPTTHCNFPIMLFKFNRDAGTAIEYKTE